jgi:outer membrane protein assembly factor BamB
VLLVGGAFVAGGLATAAVSAVLSQQVIADTDHVHLRIVRTSADSFDSGWHVHPGVAIVQVQQGSFQIYQGSCTPTTVGAGQTYIEVPHLAVRAIASGPVSWTSTLITSGGDSPQIPLATYYNSTTYNPCPSLP